MEHYVNKKLVLNDGREVEIPMRDDGYISATKLCQSVGKRLDMWRKSPDTKKFTELVKQYTNLTDEQLILVKRGGNDKNSQGSSYPPQTGDSFSNVVVLVILSSSIQLG